MKTDMKIEMTSYTKTEMKNEMTTDMAFEMTSSMTSDMIFYDILYIIRIYKFALISKLSLALLELDTAQS